MSAKSERVFSTGGNFVTKKRSRLAPKKVEELIVIKENKSLIETFKSKGTYELKSTNSNPFNEITVDEVLKNMLEEEELDDLEDDSDDDSYYEGKDVSDDEEDNE